MAVVTFDYAAWTTRFPELASVAQPLAQLYFNEAGMVCDNTDSSPITDVGRRAILLNLLTAHWAAINATVAGVAPSPLVGRITGAAQGSVNVQTEMPADPSQMAGWLNQTRYGAQYVALIARYRRGFYVGGRPRYA